MPQHKIISLVPSVTLLLFDLGLENDIIGRTKFCIHPKEKVSKIPTVGGTKNIDLAKIKALQPTLIFATKEENVKEQIQQLQMEFKVVVFDIKNLEDNYKMMEKIGKLTQTEAKAFEIMEQTKSNFSTIQKLLSNIPTLYLIWRKPYMSIGKDTFIHAMLETIGLKNMFAHQTRYPIINNLQTSYFANCKLVLLSSEPYPFTEKHIAEIRQQMPNAKILLVDGEYFSWYGSKMLNAPAYFQELLNKINR